MLATRSAPIESPPAFDPAERTRLGERARELFEMGLCCAVEVRSERDQGNWEPRVLVFGPGTCQRVVAVTEETARLEHPVRLAGYSPLDLRRIIS